MMTSSIARITCITGGASGLGWALAQQCLARGDQIILVDRDATLLHERLALLTSPDRVHGIVCDITEATSPAALMAEITERWGRLDLLIHSAGITHRSPAKQTAPEVIRRVMEVNYHAPVAITHALLPLLIASKGSIVAIGSMAGWMPIPGRAGYGASKSALTQYFEVLRLELAAHDVHVLLCHPTFLNSPMEHNALGADGQRTVRPRSTIGRIRSVEWQARELLGALDARRATTAMERLPAFGALLWRLWPALYRRLMVRRFPGELG